MRRPGRSVRAVNQAMETASTAVARVTDAASVTVFASTPSVRGRVNVSTASAQVLPVRMMR